MKTIFLKVAFVFFLAGTILFLYDVKGLINGYLSKTWPSTSGTIITSEISMTLISHYAHYREHYTPLIEYSYTVNNVVYTNNRLDLGKQISGPPQFLGRIINAFPVGSEVIVYYDPEDPMSASIEPGIATSTYLHTGTGSLFLVIAFISFGLSFYIANPAQEISPQSRSGPITMLQKIDAQDNQSLSEKPKQSKYVTILIIWLLGVLLIGALIGMIYRLN